MILKAFSLLTVISLWSSTLTHSLVIDWASSNSSEVLLGSPSSNSSASCSSDFDHVRWPEDAESPVQNLTLKLATVESIWTARFSNRNYYVHSDPLNIDREPNLKSYLMEVRSTHRVLVTEYRKSKDDRSWKAKTISEPFGSKELCRNVKASNGAKVMYSVELPKLHTIKQLHGTIAFSKVISDT